MLSSFLSSLPFLEERQRHVILSFLLYFCPGYLQLSQLFLQCSVPRSAFKDFSITRLRRLSALVDQGPKIETKD